MIEYKTLDFNNEEKIEQTLSQLSGEGWKVVLAFGKNNRYILLKRKIAIQ